MSALVGSRGADPAAGLCVWMAWIQQGWVGAISCPCQSCLLLCPALLVQELSEPMESLYGVMEEMHCERLAGGYPL